MAAPVEADDAGGRQRAAASDAGDPSRAAPFAGDGDGACSGAESFALMVLGDSMMPEFAPGDIVVIEPDGALADGSYVLAFWGDEWIFRQLLRRGDAWQLAPLNPRHERIAIPDLTPVRGVIIQKSTPGRRRASRRYVG